MQYKIIRTDTAELHIRNIILRIAESFGVEIALEKLEKLENDLSMLKDNPNLGVIPRYPILKRQGYRILILEKNFVFYKVNTTKKVVTIYAVLDQRQDYINILNGI